MNATLVLQRDSGYVDFIRRYKVLLDGEQIGAIRNGGRFECQVPPGRHVLQLKIDWCGSNAVEFEVGAGEAIRFECGSNLRGRKAANVGKAMISTPNEWIWLSRASS